MKARSLTCCPRSGRATLHGTTSHVQHLDCNFFSLQLFFDLLSSHCLVEGGSLMSSHWSRADTTLSTGVVQVQRTFVMKKSFSLTLIRTVAPGSIQWTFASGRLKQVRKPFRQSPQVKYRPIPRSRWPVPSRSQVQGQIQDLWIKSGLRSRLEGERSGVWGRSPRYILN